MTIPVYTGKSGQRTHSSNQEIRYKIDAKGQVDVIYASGFTDPINGPLDYLDDMKSEIMERVGASLPPGVFPKRSTGQIYLRRSQTGGSISPAANHAIRTNLISARFAQQMAQWNLQIIQGQ